MSEELSAKVDALVREFEELQDDATFAEELDEMVDLEADIEGLRPKLEALRKSGYKYKNFLEKKVDSLAEKWQQAKPKAQAALRKVKRTGDPLMKDLTEELAALRSRPSTGKAAAFETKLSSAQSKINALASEIEATFDNISRTYYQTQSQINELEWAMEQLSEATFKLTADESLVQATKAEWQLDRDNAENPDGILYLTDHRLLFEQKQKVTTKKILFIPTEKQLVQELKFEAPITAIEDMNRHTEGIFRTEEHLDLELGQGAPFAEADFRLKGHKSKEWIGVIKHTLAGDLQFEIVGQSAEQAALEVNLAEAPTDCDACGAPVPLLPAAKRQYECEYCGSVMRW